MLVMLLALLALGACRRGSGVEIPEVDVPTAARMFASEGAVPVDANSEGTRESYGVIPGATVLSSSSRYDVAKELPADRATPLVFYCANDYCTASDSAAERAMAAGYKKVSLMRPGIFGWKDAGQKIKKVPSS